MCRPGTTTLQSAVRLIAARATSEVGGRVLSRRRRDQAQARLEDLLAVSGRLRRAAAFDFAKSRKCQSRRPCCCPAPMRFPDGAAATRSATRATWSFRCMSCRAMPASRSRCGSSSTTRSARSSACRRKPSSSCSSTGADERRRRDAQRGRGAGAEAAAVGDGAALAIRAVRREAGSGKPRVVVDVAAPAGATSTCSPKGRPRNGRCRCRSRSPARPRACSASPSSSTACRPARAATGATLRLTAVAGRQGDRGRIPSRLIRRSALI